MRFCDLFIAYKIGLKGIKSTIPFTKLPLYKKIFVIIPCASAIISVILLVLNLTRIAFIPAVLGGISLIIFLIMDSSKNNLKEMLSKHYEPYSEERMNMVINVLTQYRIDIHNVASLDMLITEAQYAQIYCNYLEPLKKPCKVLGGMIIPIIAFVVKKIANAIGQIEMITMAVMAISLILLVFSLLFLIIPILKEILYLDYNKYNEFIYDLRQIKIFYSK